KWTLVAGTPKIKGITVRYGEDARLRCVAKNRRRAQLCQLESAAGPGIIAARRTRSAHLRHPWRAPLRQVSAPRPELPSYARSCPASLSQRDRDWLLLHAPGCLRRPRREAEVRLRETISSIQREANERGLEPDHPTRAGRYPSVSVAQT